MTPLANSANPPAQLNVGAAEKLLDGGEVILLATRPSGWFVLLASWPVLAVAALVCATTAIGHKASSISLPWRSVFFLCGVITSIRLALACTEWVGQLYILTTQRVLRLSGVFKATIDDCPLRTIAETVTAASGTERMLGVANLLFKDDQGQALEPTWTCLARPDEIRQAVEDAINRAK